MKCWKCGNETAPGARFCGVCGADLSQAPQGQPGGPTPPPPPPGPQHQEPWNTNPGGNEMILKVFAAVCAVLYGVTAVRRVFSVLGGVLDVLRFHFSILSMMYLIVNGLTAVLCVWMAGVMIMFVMKRTPQNTDGLLLLLAGGGVGVIAVRLLSTLITALFNSYAFLDSLKSFFLWTLGAVAAVAGMYAILRFLLGENPLVGKDRDVLAQEVRDTVSTLTQTASEAAQDAKASWDAQQQAKQEQRTQQAQWAQQNAQYQAAPGQPAPPPMGYAPYRLKADRSLIAYILLNLITCGIYGWYFLYALARDVNVVCAGDGKTTAGLVKLILLSFITCGIYSFFWYYNLGNRLSANAPRYGLNFQENGTTVLLWMVLGSMLCGIGPFIAMHIIIKNTNALCGAYNYQHGI